MKSTFFNTLKRKVWNVKKEELGLGTLELVLIIGVIIVIGLIFKNQITSIIQKLLKKVSSKSDDFFQ